MSTPANAMDFKVNIIVATEASRGIGLKGLLPWKLPLETNYYHGMINSVSPGKQNAVIIGRITYESIRDPADYENLLKVVVSKGTQPKIVDKNLRYVSSFQEAVSSLIKEKTVRDNIETVWILGGAGIYRETLESSYLHRVYLTKVLSNLECDTFFPEMDLTQFRKVSDDRVNPNVQTDNGVSFQVEIYERSLI